MDIPATPTHARGPHTAAAAPHSPIEPGRYSIYDHIETLPGGREEIMEEVSSDFGYNPVRSEHDRYAGGIVPWHWHQELELFMVEQGQVVYEVPHFKTVVSAGDVGLVNANVLHSTHAKDGMHGANMRIHMFRPALIAEPGSLIYKRYVEPLVSATSVGLLLARTDGDAFEQQLCRDVAGSFGTFERGAFGWEIGLRNELSRLWLAFLKLAEPRLAEGPAQMPRAAEERMRAMLDYVGLHYFEDITVADIAAAGLTSERGAHRTFKEELGTTPVRYLREYRVEQACRMLAHTTRPLATVGKMCGLGSPSYFAQVFKASTGRTPSQYRAEWQDGDIERRNSGNAAGGGV